MGAFDGELSRLGYSSRSVRTDQKDQKHESHRLLSPLTCLVSRVYEAGNSFTPRGYILSLSRKGIKEAKEGGSWYTNNGMYHNERYYVKYYEKKDAERVVVNHEVFQTIIDNYLRNGTDYVFVRFLDAIKLENLSRHYA